MCNILKRGKVVSKQVDRQADQVDLCVNSFLSHIPTYVALGKSFLPSSPFLLPKKNFFRYLYGKLRFFLHNWLLCCNELSDMFKGERAATAAAAAAACKLRRCLNSQKHSD